LAAGTVGVAAAAAALLFTQPSASKITKESLDRIEVGMTAEQVERVLGGPAGDYRTGPTLAYYVPWLKISPGAGEIARWVEWQADAGTIVVGYDANGKASQKEFQKVTQAEQSFLGHLVWRANRQWRRWFPE
jgi:hypothetical protein